MYTITYLYVYTYILYISVQIVHTIYDWLEYAVCFFCCCVYGVNTHST